MVFMVVVVVIGNLRWILMGFSKDITAALIMIFRLLVIMVRCLTTKYWVMIFKLIQTWILIILKMVF